MNITSEQYRKQLAPKRGRQKRGKFNNVKTFYDGKKFDSKKECDRYKELKGMKISNLECQVKFPITINGVKVCSYIADFVYTDRNGNRVIEDVKGFKTDIYRLKKKLIKAVYGVEIKEV